MAPLIRVVAMLVPPIWLLATAFTYAAQYTVEGFTLGDRVVAGSPNYRAYTCKPSDDFAGATRCERRRQQSARAGSPTISSTLIHTEDGTAIYIMTNAAPVSLNRSTVEREIGDLTRELTASPSKVEWLPEGNPTSVIATWGPVRLEEIKDEQDLQKLIDGQSPHLGVLVDSIGNIQSSAQQGLTIYRISGGPGYVYSASFGGSRGHRHYVAVDGPQLAVRQYTLALQAVLQKDGSLGPEDYRLWPDVALLTRNLARDTSPRVANAALDKIFDQSHSVKLRSHVWSVLPLGAIARLAADEYSRLDHYGPQTEYPGIRQDVEDFLAHQQPDRFAEFGYFLLGDFERALRANPNSPISNVLHYGSGYKIIQSLMQDALEIAGPRTTRTTSPGVKAELKELLGESPESKYYVDSALRTANQNPDLYGNKFLGTVLPDFDARATAARIHFEAVLRHPSSNVADDAAYMLGWLNHAQGKLKEALPYYSQAMVIGNADYKPAALKEVVRILERFPARDQLAIVESSSVFAQQPALWYTAARSAYREFDYRLAIDAAERALKVINVPIEQVPVSTDPNRIESALEKINSNLIADPNVSELPYLIYAAKELSEYLASLSSASTTVPEVFIRDARKMIMKYSALVDQRETDQQQPPREVAHRDLRQAIHLIDMTMRSTPKTVQYAHLREWMHYRKVRILAAFAPERVPEEIAALRQEFPSSRLVGNALAEQIFAQAITMKDPDAADKTFRQLLEEYPNSNAVDNAYSWMAIGLRCAGRSQAAEAMNKKIVQKFPLTRHARYARDRLAHPDRNIDVKDCGWPRG